MPLRYRLRTEEESRQASRPETQAVSSSTEHLPTLLSKAEGNVLILGVMGSGKTTLLHQLLHHQLEAWQPRLRLPVPLALRSWAAREAPFGDWLAQEFFANYDVPPDIATRWIANNKLILFLDGLDEMSPEASERCAQAIIAWAKTSASGMVKLVITCRTVTYDQLKTQLPVRCVIRLLDLNEEDVDAALAHDGQRHMALRTLLKRNQDLRTLSRTPLVLRHLIDMDDTGRLSDLPSGTSPEEIRHHVLTAWIAARLVRVAPSSRGWVHSQLLWLADHLARGKLDAIRADELQPSWLDTERQRQVYLWLSRTAVSFLIVFLSAVILRFSSAEVQALPLGWLAFQVVEWGTLMPLMLMWIESGHRRRQPRPEDDVSLAFGSSFLWGALCLAPIVLAVHHGLARLGLDISPLFHLDGSRVASLALFAVPWLILSYAYAAQTPARNYTNDIVLTDQLSWSVTTGLLGGGALILLAYGVFRIGYYLVMTAGLTSLSPLFGVVTILLLFVCVLAITVGAVSPGNMEPDLRPYARVARTLRSARNAFLMFALPLMVMNLAYTLLFVAPYRDHGVIERNLLALWPFYVLIGIAGASRYALHVIHYAVLRLILDVNGRLSLKEQADLETLRELSFLQRRGASFSFVHDEIRAYYTRLLHPSR